MVVETHEDFRRDCTKTVIDRFPLRTVWGEYGPRTHAWGFPTHVRPLLAGVIPKTAGEPLNEPRIGLSNSSSGR
jgi:hypothetical protein